LFIKNNGLSNATLINEGTNTGRNEMNQQQKEDLDAVAGILVKGGKLLVNPDELEKFKELRLQGVDVIASPLVQSGQIIAVKTDERDALKAPPRDPIYWNYYD
jgi:Cft2 family RNA processing exonuclease